MKKFICVFLSLVSLTASAETLVYGSLFMALGAGHSSKTYFSNIAKISSEISLTRYAGDSSEVLSRLKFSSANVEGDQVTYFFNYTSRLESNICSLDLKFTTSDKSDEGLKDVIALHHCHSDQD